MDLPRNIDDWPPDYFELWAERAAIIEYLADFPRLKAEFIAEKAVREMAKEESWEPLT